MSRIANLRFAVPLIFVLLQSCGGHGSSSIPSVNSEQNQLTDGAEALRPAVAPEYTDWKTFGDTLGHTGHNDGEKTLSASAISAAGGLRLLWSSTDLGGAIDAQPLLATDVTINGVATNVLYIGAENNIFYAINADTGAIIWKNTTFGPAQHGNCTDLPGGQFGITDTAGMNKQIGTVYVADGSGYLHALSMTTGVEIWKTNVLFDPNTHATVGSAGFDHIYGAVTFNPSNNTIYVGTGSLCEVAPWHGRIVAISPTTQTVTAAFFPGRTGSGKTGTTYCGGGVWGMGGASIDTKTNNVFITTGNNVTTAIGGCPADTTGETYPYGDAVVELTPQLNLISFATALINGKPAGFDLDYGATAMLYNAPGCGLKQLSAKNKDGYVYTYGIGAAGLVAEQSLSIAQKTSGGDFIGVPAYDPSNHLVYVGNPKAVGNFAHGLEVFAQAGGCTGLALSWQASIGSANATAQDNEAPTTANGVVYFTDGTDNQVWAFNDRTGATLWHSGTAIGAPCATYGTTCGVFGAATVDGRVFVGSFNHKLYAFGL
jgi:outer membrane protein assembly factor BamB